MKAQGLPINMIVLVALALLVLVIVGAFFISGFTQAGSSVSFVNKTQAECQTLCAELSASAGNYDDCETFQNTEKAIEYANSCEAPCIVNLRGGEECEIS